MTDMKPGKFKVQHWRRGELDPEDVFVLVPSRDPAAVDAIRAYADSCSDPVLAGKLTAWADRIENVEESAVITLDVETRIAVWTGVLADRVRSGDMEVETALQRIAGHALNAARRQGDRKQAEGG